jgi:integrase
MTNRLFLCRFHISDVFTEGIWKTAKELNSNKLENLLESLPKFQMCCKAPSTTQKYKNEWLKWKKWESSHFEESCFPVPPLFISLYLRDKFDSCNSCSPITAAVYGIKWAHELAGVDSPTDHPFVKQTVEASRRLLGKPLTQKLPIDLSIIQLVVDRFNKPLALVQDMRICFIFVIGFAGLLRCNEIIGITRDHIVLHSDHMTIFVPQRKNDQYKKGHTVYISRFIRFNLSGCHH